MVSKFTILILLMTLLSCGKEVKLSSNKLETYNNITLADPIVVDKTGTLIRKNINDSNDKVVTGGKTLIVSKYSSHQAFTQINSRAEGIQVAIKYKGQVKGSEIVLEVIEF
jgi:hypothetical protein